ncbi:MAG: HPr(Ser) kinase/phosphatase [Bacilli bacterium]
MPKIRTKDLISNFKLDVIAGEKGIERGIATSDLYRPGIQIAGFYTYYPNERVQLLGKTELTFFETLTEEQRKERVEILCTPVTPAIIVTRDLEVPQELLAACEEHGVPLLQTGMTTTRAISRITNFLESKLAPFTAVHGVLVDIYGIGVLITGSSGVGKSETALELIKRGHRLVADDSVEIRQEDEFTLVGSSPELIEHLLEIRGLGIINVMTLFGAGSVRNLKRVSLNIHLETWEQGKVYDRLGLDEDKLKILDTQITKLVVPVRPGRNLAVIIEVAAMNFRLKRMGMDAAQQFADRLHEVIDTKELD